MAEVFVGDFAHVPDAEVVAVGSRREETAKAFAERYDVRGAYAYRGLLDDPDVDVVYVATPHPQHHALAIAAIEAGKPVLVEKAFTATLAGAQEIADLARARGVFCMEAMWTRFLPAVVHARELVAAGEIGDVLMVQADLGAYRAYDPATRLFDPLLGGGATLDLGVYVVSIAQHFLGAPDRVHAVGTLFPNGADASAAIQMEYDDGRSASLICSLQGESPGRAVVLGTGGSVELVPRFHHPARLVIRRNDRPVEEVELVATGRGYVHEIVEVGRCLAEGLTESPVMSLADTVAVQAVLQSALEQLGITPAEDDTFVI
jgi:predicted dehydrogenase